MDGWSGRNGCTGRIVEVRNPPSDHIYLPAYNDSSPIASAQRPCAPPAGASVTRPRSHADTCQQFAPCPPALTIITRGSLFFTHTLRPPRVLLPFCAARLDGVEIMGFRRHFEATKERKESQKKPADIGRTASFCQDVTLQGARRLPEGPAFAQAMRAHSRRTGTTAEFSVSGHILSLWLQLAFPGACRDDTQGTAQRLAQPGRIA